MAQDPQQSQYAEIYTLGLEAGIKRDGTAFESRECSDGVWCRFQRGVPKKIGGYQQIFSTFNGIPRGITMNSYNGVNYIFSGNNNGLDAFATGQSFGVGGGPFICQLLAGYSPFTVATSNTSSITIASTTNYTSVFTGGNSIVFNQSTTPVIYTVSSSTYNATSSQTVSISIASPAVITYTAGSVPTNGTAITFSTTGALPTGITAATTYYVINSSGTTSNISLSVGGTAIVTSGTQSGTQSVSFGATTVVSFTTVIPSAVTTAYFSNTYFSPNSRLLWQFDYQYSISGGSLNLIAHPGLNLANIDSGVPSQVYVGSTLPGSSDTWTFTGLADTGGTQPTYKPIVVDGGVCVLHPFIFVYGSNGFIANNNVSSIYENQLLTDWNGPLANQVNVATGKVVKGMPVRGGTASPSGLFWATDSLIRVSFVNNGSIYWQYDIISSQISIMSSSAVVEMDGVYYWMGVVRFYVYNGYVTVLPNDKNVNWLFNNLNYQQRQKVWATKIPRYNEIWFFYPRGSATECTDAIIYNVKDKIWYDAGQAEGAQRSSGITTEVFPSPIWGDWHYNESYGPQYYTIATPPGQPATSRSVFYIAGDVTTTVLPSSYITSSTTITSANYQISSSAFVFNSTIGGVGATKIILNPTTIFPTIPAAGTPIYAVSGGYGIWQHETGLNKINTSQELAIYSSFTTCDISWVGGTPSNDGSPAVNRRMHLRRIEPDFVMGGSLELNINGRKFAQSPSTTSGPFKFDSNTEKIDLRVEYREMDLTFVSNELDGNYEMGRILLTVEYGDERP